MLIPPVSHPVWTQLVTGQKMCQFDSLATKIFLGSAKLRASQDASPENIRKLGAGLHELFVKNQRLPSVQQDLSKLAE